MSAWVPVEGWAATQGACLRCGFWAWSRAQHRAQGAGVRDRTAIGPAPPTCCCLWNLALPPPPIIPLFPNPPPPLATHQAAETKLADLSQALAEAEAVKASLLRDSQLALGARGDLKQSLNMVQAKVSRLEAQMAAAKGEASATSLAAREASRRAQSAEAALKESESRRAAAEAAARAAELQRASAMAVAQGAIGREGDLKQALNKAKQSVGGAAG